MGTGPDGTTYQIGEMAGTEQETLTVQQIPNHSHPLTASLDVGGQAIPTSNVLAQSTIADMYIQDTPDGALARPRWGPWGAASRTRTPSRSSASTSSSPCSGSSRARPEEASRMSDQFVAEIRIFPFNFPPTGWAFCDGQLMPISQNTALFSLSAPCTAATARAPSRFPTCRAARPCSPARGRG
jgi:microcystin-dependent protein